jgi:hypothetical protein
VKLGRPVQELTDEALQVETELLECPLSLAAMQRQIGTYGAPIATELLRRQYADATPAEVLNDAVRAEQRGETLQAIALYDVASKGYQGELATLLTEAPTQRALAGSLVRALELAPPAESARIFSANWNFQESVSTLADHLGTAAPSNVVIDVTAENASRFRTFTSDRLAVVLHDYGRAVARGNNLRLQMMGSDFVDATPLTTAIRATAIGATVAANRGWSELNLDTLQYSLDSLSDEVGLQLVSRRPNRVLLQLSGEVTAATFTDSSTANEPPWSADLQQMEVDQ